MTTYHPSISVIVPCYNQGHFLSEAVQSVLRQTYPHVNVVIVDDGSTDATAAVAEQLVGERVRYLYKKNAGLSAARNSGILAASGEFVQFLDADDYLRAEALQHFVAGVALEPQGDIYFGAWDVVDEAGGLLRHVLPVFEASENALHRYLRGNVFPCHAAIVRLRTLANSGLFDPSLPSFEDWDLWIRLARAGARFIAVHEATVAYRQHPGSMSKSHDRMRDAGNAVLAKTSLLHPGCSECATARAWGRRELRFHLYQNLLGPELESVLAEKGPAAMLSRLYGACVADPAVGWLALRRGLRHLLKPRAGVLAR